RRTSFSLMSPRSPRPTLFPYTTLFRSHAQQVLRAGSLIALANDRIFVVVIHGQNDILVHGGLHKSRPLGPDPLNANHWPSSGELDRKSTRLNSSHVAISYAVFCLKRKT